MSVVIPTYNEAKNLPQVLGRIPPDVHEIVIVDGHSIDDTVGVARSLRPDVKVVLQNRMGKGNALTCGFAAVTGDIVVMLEADGSTDPQEIPRFLAALLAGADVAKGSRFIGSEEIAVRRVWGSRWLNRLSNALFGVRYTDLCYGYTAFWRDCLDRLELDPGPGYPVKKLWGDGFEIETVINTRMAKAGARVTEVPSLGSARSRGAADPSSWRDGALVLRALVVERVNGVARATNPVGLPIAVGGMGSTGAQVRG